MFTEGMAVLWNSVVKQRESDSIYQPGINRFDIYFWTLI